MLADYVGLAPATVSLVMNRSLVAETIPQHTRDLIFAAADKFNYRPNFFARSLRTQRSFSIGVIVPEMSEGYATLVLSGIEDYLLQAGYFYFVASHRHKPDLIDEYPKLLLGRSVDGIISVDTPWKDNLPVPIVAVSGHDEINGITNVVVDHELGAELALKHLLELGHRRLAFIKGQEFSSDTKPRWDAIRRCAQNMGLPVSSRLVGQLEGDTATPELGCKVTRKLIKSQEPFTALFAFNDISAIGAIHALREAGFDVPTDVSVVGFDDIQSAAYQNPALTTVKQPLRKMGKIAAETLLRRIDSADVSSASKCIVVEPEFIVRASTGQAPKGNCVRAATQSRSAGVRHSSKSSSVHTKESVQMVVQTTGLSEEMAKTVVELLVGNQDRPSPAAVTPESPSPTPSQR